jgi:hypothetical protein
MGFVFAVEAVVDDLDRFGPEHRFKTYLAIDGDDLWIIGTGDPATGWATVGTVQYVTENQFFHPYLRHRFDLKAETDAVVATGLRIKVSDGNLDIDELEINPQENIKIENAPGFAISWDGNDGEFFSPDAGAAPPDNLALATKGAFSNLLAGFPDCH